MSQAIVNFMVAWLAICAVLALAALVQDWRECQPRGLEPFAIVLLRWLMLGLVLLASPFYALWTALGRRADRRGQRRRVEP